ncbi:hypothetical protein [Coleofasciculus sp. FACHB-SPT9]|uniref:hypothetical protein n=1 Tax=Cyanophyceae TaxID=3028117 RepID=UPI001687D6A0|nr:hypothetical protein [Coleofasciculus sp. FACHB-SPT9]MBD1893000.1 hypothetical protein [Coleofasciculus sp. FACHB-SPT9]
MTENTVYTPQPGSSERKQILDALHRPVAASAKQSGWIQSGVPKSVRELGIQARDFTDALQQTHQLQRNSRLKCYRTGEFDNGICALLHKPNRRWRTVEFVIGATDIPDEG